MITIKPYTPTPAYEAFLGTQSTVNSYHNPAWWRVLAQTYGYQPASLLAWDAERVVGVLPLMHVHGLVKGRRLVSLPFSHVVPILAEDDRIKTALLEYALDMTRRENYRYLELRPRQPLQHQAFRPSTANYISELDLSPARADLFRAFSSSNRRNIRKAEKSNAFTIREGHSDADFRAFYELEVATRMYQGAPVYSKRFFPAVKAELGDEWRLYMMSKGIQDVAGILVLRRGAVCIYGYGAWLRTDELRKLYPMNLLVWRALITAKQEGFKVFDFGTTPLHNEGLLDFKQRYNPALSELPYWYFLHTKDELPTIDREGGAVKLVERVLQSLPRWAFVRLSPFLLREVG